MEHRTKEGFTPLMFAALGGHVDVAKLVCTLRFIIVLTICVYHVLHNLLYYRLLLSNSKLLFFVSIY